MFTVKQITVGVERTINLGNYENVRYSVQTTVDLDDSVLGPNLTVDEVYDNRLTWCKEKVLAELLRLQPPTKEKSKF